MIVDTFAVNDELDILEKRLRYYDNYVDFFVLVESNSTFSGNLKPLHFQENRDRFKEFEHKIRYMPYIIDPSEYNFDVKIDSIDYGTDHWRFEFEQKNHTIQGVKDLPDDAIIMYSDVDEIMNRETLAQLPSLMEGRERRRFCQDLFYYNLNTRCTAYIWDYVFACRKKLFVENKPVTLRLERHHPDNDHVFNAGWHFSYFMSPELIKNKIESFSHQELNKEKFTSLNHIQDCVDNGKDLYSREDYTFEIVSLDRYPSDMLEIFKDFAKRGE